MDEIKSFVKSLSNKNSFSQSENLYEGNNKISKIRRHNLEIYLRQMKKLNPSVLLVGEAPGHKGCRLTGIAFTSEKIIRELDFYKDKGYKIISEGKQPETEASSTILWNELVNYTNIPLIWNIFPFHPHDLGNNNSNRTPRKDELVYGKEVLNELIEIFEIKMIVAIGRKSESQIKDIYNNYVYIRHPANGGKSDFIKGLRAVIT